MVCMAFYLCDLVQWRGQSGSGLAEEVLSELPKLTSYHVQKCRRQCHGLSMHETSVVSVLSLGPKPLTSQRLPRTGKSCQCQRITHILSSSPRV